MFSRRSDFGSEINPVTIAWRHARSSGKSLFDLTESNPTRARLPYDVSAIVTSLASTDPLQYNPDPKGSVAARNCIVGDLRSRGIVVSPERVLLTTSTSEAYSYLFKLLCDEGDEVLVPQPSYPLLGSLAQLEGVRLRWYRLSYDGRWHIDLHSLRAAITKRSKAIVVVHPNNPTGSFVKRDEFDALAATGLPIVSDEVFGEYALDVAEHAPTTALQIDASLVFRLDGISKSAALPQLKLGWTIIDGHASEVAAAMERLETIADSFLSPGSIVQGAIGGLLGSRHAVRNAIRQRAIANVRTIQTEVHHSAVSTYHVEGGWYAVLRLPATRSEDEWVVAFAEHDGVFVQPGYFYDFTSGVHVVLSLLVPEDVFAEGLRRIVTRVDREA